MKKISCLALLILITSCLSKQELAIVEGVDLELAAYRKANINTISYELDFRIPKQKEQAIQGYEVLSFNLLSIEQDLQLDFNAPTEHIKAIVVNKKSHEIDHRKEHIIIKKEFLTKGFNRIEINFYVGESSLNRQEEFLYTLFVPDRARTAFPVFDQPNLKAKYTLKLDIPADWQAIGNAPVGLLSVKEGRKSISYQQSDLMSSYLFSFVAGKFETITEQIDGRVMTMLHRETDLEKVKRNKELIFYLHAAALRWMETYTGIKYPFKKFDFALIPGFQYGGMEHVGAIQYRANSLMLDEDPSQSQLLSRASLIGHETAHMWFGDLVTMDWFNDVWTKEVFANFMAAKMVNPSFPEIDHELNFLLRHYPSAYGVDRTAGANPIRQELQNLNEAGQMYGAIIYNKAPIMMRQLESLIGVEAFRAGLQEYLQEFADKNATWPDLINILDRKTQIDLHEWSAVWVNEPGRPHFEWELNEKGEMKLKQFDPSEQKVWPQVFRMKLYNGEKVKELEVSSGADAFETSVPVSRDEINALFNSNAMGYGLFPVNFDLFPVQWNRLSDLEKGSLLINAFEQLLEPSFVGKEGQYSPMQYLETLQWVMAREQNSLLIGQVLSQAQRIYWNLLRPEQRQEIAGSLERAFFDAMDNLHDDPSIKKSYFNAFKNVAITEQSLNRLYQIWAGEERIEGLKLSENDMISLSAQLAIKIPEKAEQIIEVQAQNITNPDSKKRYAFVSGALSPDRSVRDAKFASFKDLENRAIESWVLASLGYLHHPLRTAEGIDYIRPSLDLLQNIQVTGDIFFPKRWLDQTLSNHNSDQALAIVDAFISEYPEYNEQLKMKILQAVDFAKRANKIKKAWMNHSSSDIKKPS